MGKTIRRHEHRPQNERTVREAEIGKWSLILVTAVKEAGFQIQEREKDGMIEIHDQGKILAHAPRNIPSQKTLRSVLSDLGMTLESL